MSSSGVQGDFNKLSVFCHFIVINFWVNILYGYLWGENIVYFPSADEGKDKRSNTLLILIMLFVPFFLVNIYAHEYIHYWQASCSESCNDSFIERFGWGWKEGAPSGAVAYMDITDCPDQERVNEAEPLAFNLIFSLAYVSISARLFFKKRSPPLRYRSDLPESLREEV